MKYGVRYARPEGAGFAVDVVIPALLRRRERPRATTVAPAGIAAFEVEVLAVGIEGVLRAVLEAGGSRAVHVNFRNSTHAGTGVAGPGPGWATYAGDDP